MQTALLLLAVKLKPDLHCIPIRKCFVMSVCLWIGAVMMQRKVSGHRPLPQMKTVSIEVIELAMNVDHKPLGVEVPLPIFHEDTGWRVVCAEWGGGGGGMSQAAHPVLVQECKTAGISVLMRAEDAGISAS